MEKIVVTGIGVISAAGSTVEQNRQSLVNGRSGITRGEAKFPSRYAALLPFGVVNHTDAQLAAAVLLQSCKGVTRTTLLAMHAFNQAVADAGLTTAQLAASGTALIGGTTIGGMGFADELYANTHGNQTNTDYLQAYDYSSVSLFMQQHYGIGGVVNTINTACSSSANAIMYGCRLINQGLATRAIVGGADSLSKFSANGFNALRILTHEPCTPFDANRKGLNLGEGAAFLVLEKESHAQGKKIYAQVSGYGNANDAYHPSSLSPGGDGPLLAMQQALRTAGLQPQDIDFINAHGTGTENNDEAELHAMQQLFGRLPRFASTKAFTGHTLGAASAIEAVYSILSIAGQELYANLNFTNPIEGHASRPLTDYTPATVKHVMSNSFGFGGNCTSLVFSAV